MSSQTEPINFNRAETIDNASFGKTVFVHPLERAVQPSDKTQSITLYALGIPGDTITAKMTASQSTAVS